MRKKRNRKCADLLRQARSGPSKLMLKEYGKLAAWLAKAGRSHHANEAARPLFRWETIGRQARRV